MSYAGGAIRKFDRLLTIFYCVVVAIVLSIPSAFADPSCVEEYYIARNGNTALDEANEIQKWVETVLASIGLQRPIRAIPCRWAESAIAWHADADQFQGVPEGDYIIYKAGFLQNVAGSDEPILLALIAHEVAHILNGDLTTRSEIPKKDREGDADYFAGCIVARLEYSPNELQGLVDRVRQSKGDGRYPDQLESTLIVKEGYKKCSRYVSGKRVDFDQAEEVARKALEMFASDSHKAMHQEILSDWTRDRYSISILEKIGSDFKHSAGFGELLSVQRVGASAVSGEPNYPSGTYAHLVFSVKTTTNNFIANVMVGWQSPYWKVYEYNFSIR